MGVVPVRPADPERDALRCAEIYAPAIESGYASFEDEAPDAAEMAARMAASHVWLMAERDGAVAGYAYAGAHHVREGYRWAVNVAVYVDAAHRGHGVGRELYGVLLPELQDRGLRWAVAGIALPNPPSVRLHRALGFRVAGVFRDIGYKAGAWRDVSWWQRELNRFDDSPPPEPRVVRAR